MFRLDVNETDRIKVYLNKNIFFDLTHPASWGKDQVECAIKVCGADHMLLGTTFPVFYAWMSAGVNFMKTLDISEADRQKIMCDNAMKLFKLEKFGVQASVKAAGK